MQENYCLQPYKRSAAAAWFTRGYLLKAPYQDTSSFKAQRNTEGGHAISSISQEQVLPSEVFSEFGALSLQQRVIKTDSSGQQQY